MAKQRASKQLRRWSEHLRSYKRHRRTLIKELDQILTEGTKQRIETATTPDGKPHAPLSPEYLKRKIKSGYDPRIWHRTGKAANAVKTRTTNKGTMIIDIDTPYADYVDKGTKHAPARPVLGLSDEEEQKIEERIAELFNKVTK